MSHKKFSGKKSPTLVIYPPPPSINLQSQAPKFLSIKKKLWQNSTDFIYPKADFRWHSNKKKILLEQLKINRLKAR